MLLYLNVRVEGDADATEQRRRESASGFLDSRQDGHRVRMRRHRETEKDLFAFACAASARVRVTVAEKPCVLDCTIQMADGHLVNYHGKPMNDWCDCLLAVNLANECLLP